MSQTIRRRAQGPTALTGGIEEPILPLTFVGDGFNVGVWVENQDPGNVLQVVTVYSRPEFDAAEEADVNTPNIAVGAAAMIRVDQPCKWIRVTATPAAAIAACRAYVQITEFEQI